MEQRRRWQRLPTVPLSVVTVGTLLCTGAAARSERTASTGAWRESSDDTGREARRRARLKVAILPEGRVGKGRGELRGAAKNRVFRLSVGQVWWKGVGGDDGRVPSRGDTLLDLTSTCLGRGAGGKGLGPLDKLPLRCSARGHGTVLIVEAA